MTPAGYLRLCKQFSDGGGGEEKEDTEAENVYVNSEQAVYPQQSLLSELIWVLKIHMKTETQA